MANTPNMDLSLPIVSETLGPTWASDLNTALEDVDAHDHTSGKGLQIPTAGIALNADLTFNSYAATNLDYVSVDDQLAALTSNRAIYAVNGDLYYTNTAGDQVQITNGSSIAGTPGAITGLGDGGSSGVYYDVTNTLAFFHAGASQAKFDTSVIQLHAYDGTGSAPYTDFIGITAPTTTVSYNLTLPATVPTQDLPLSMSAAGVLTPGLANGTAAAPSMAFASDLDTGVYRVGANQLGMAAAGAYVGSFEAGQLKLVAGTAALPAFTFNGDPNTGFYSIGADQIGASTGGTLRLTLSTTALTSTLPVYGASGTAAAPGFSFSADTDTGMYRVSANSLALSTGGTARLTVGSSGILTASSAIVAGGAITTTSVVQADSGIYSGENDVANAVKWKVFLGTLAAGSTTSLSVPSGVVLGAYGYSTFNGSGSGQWGPIGESSTATSGTAAAIKFGNDGLNSGNSTAVQIGNFDSNSTNTYRVVVFYQ